METPGQPDETTIEGPCPRCGLSVDAIFKFCPHCGMPMKVQVVEARSDILPDDKMQKLSPEAQRRLIAFEQQFETLQQKIKASPSKSRGSGTTDTSITRFAIVLVVLILLGLIATWFVFSQMFASINGRTPQF